MILDSIKNTPLLRIVKRGGTSTPLLLPLCSGFAGIISAFTAPRNLTPQSYLFFHNCTNTIFSIQKKQCKTQKTQVNQFLERLFEKISYLCSAKQIET